MKILKQTPDFLPLNKCVIENEKLIDIYHLVFTNTHSNGFMIAEVKDLLFKDSYWFMEQQKENWQDNLKNKLIELNLL